MDGLFTDPNCSSLVPWSSWLAQLGGLDLGAYGAEPTAEGLKAQQAEEAAVQLGLGPDGSCFLGSSTLLLAQVVGAWRRGRFVAALQTFAVLHDHFLTAAHPGFFQHSAWPLSDQDVRFWKDRLLYQIRRFREIVGRRLDQGMKALDEVPDMVERENLGGFASHALQQMQQRRTGRKGNLTLRVPWELAPAAALIPSLPQVVQPVRVYVYGESEVEAIGKLTRSPAFCHYRQWGMDVGFHDFFRTSPIRTFEPEEADYFFVPSYACCHQVAGMADFDDLDADHEAVVSQLAYFQQSGGRDHIFSFHYIDLFPSWRKQIPKSVILTPETEVGFERSLGDFGLDQTRFPPFNALKDIVVPPYINLRDILGFHRHSKAMRSRSFVASFAGKLWDSESVAEAAKVRSQVAALGEAPGFRIHGYASIKDMLNSDGMQRLMGDSIFCLVPRGRAAWSVRFFEALWAGCVPVLLSDHYQPSFDQLFDATQFVIKWPVSRIDESLVSFLTSLPLDVAERYAANARNVRCHLEGAERGWYLYPPPEVSWIGDWQTRHELEEVEKHVCPNLSSSRNAFQAVVEILARRKVASRVRRGETD
ncbi:Probable glucuronosyltransferase Os01g0926400 (OsGT47D) [Durusdinium trenchii]|uniref:Probable glucuronosyltransferase Os01g0926400 (OsGT47D) n=1 Tax=Durusdinium trenchii TaxID=1381693 RepID=A0ABP0PJY0_9DINO